ncbi:erythropoietin receptor isoform X1 [Pogona vitticeps]
MEPGERWVTALLALMLWPLGSTQGSAGNLGAHFNSKVTFLLAKEPLDPKCFTQQLEDLTCFWETSEPATEQNSQATYTFAYKFQEDTSTKTCNLTVTHTTLNKTCYICFFPRQDVSAFSPMEINIFDARLPNNTLHSRDIYVEKLIFLDPPSNLSLQPLESARQVNLSWLPPPVAHMGNNLRYEVAISPKGYKTRQVESITGQTYYLMYLKSGTHYTFSVRVKASGASYDGYWSAWSETTSVEIPNDLDPLILTLSVILVLIVLLLAFITLMSNRRFLKKKMWPVIPTPEHEFKDLFTIYKGNFQLWMGHQNIYLWWSHNPLYLEEQPFMVEILSDCDGRKVDDPLPPPLPPKTHNMMELFATPEVSQDDYLVLDEDLVPGCSGGDGSLLLPDNDSSEGTDVALARTALRSPEPSQTSSSFEYIVFDPSSEGLSPQSHHQKELQLRSSYQMVSDSGISADYSLMDSSPGQMSLYTNLCDGGPQPFLPSYIVCS